MAGYGKASYVASTAVVLVAAAGTAPFFIIEGSATKKIVVTSINSMDSHSQGLNISTSLRLNIQQQLQAVQQLH